MSEVDQLIGLISNVLQGEDKAVRESAEKNIVDLRTANPNELMLAFLAVLIGKFFFIQANIKSSIEILLLLSSDSAYRSSLQPLTQTYGLI